MLNIELYNTLFNQNPKTTPCSAVTHNENHAEPTNDLVSSYRRLRVLYTNAWQNVHCLIYYCYLLFNLLLNRHRIKCTCIMQTITEVVEKLNTCKITKANLAPCKNNIQVNLNEVF